MNTHLTRLFNIAQKETRTIVGLMSGTSLDGLDVALCRITGSGGRTQVDLTHFETVDYTPEIKANIRQVFAKNTVDFQFLTVLNPWLGTLHGQMVLDCLNRWEVPAATVDVIASHGQTVLHAPKSLHGRAGFPNATLQLGDGDHVAVTTGIITLSDFRQKHLAAGGEGAPLAVYGDYFIFSKLGENRLMLNLGGIANFTYLPGTLDASAVFTTDTGPGNTLLDAFTRHFFPALSFDRDGALARAGTVSEPLLQALKSDPFFSQPFPKTTGPELFNVASVQRAQVATATEALRPEDLLATLVRFSAETIAGALRWAMQPDTPYRVYLSGGGAHNPALTDALGALLPGVTFGRTDELGIAGDAKEAVLFAILANEALVGGTTDFGGRAGVPSVTMGKISLPG
ncbi:MAG: anhydro-N-acetylmuramic acid kinase [Cytophagaceae bacterium]|nr:anhydro-N-acetylmuramic acid kinase [Cytophagaceae bacterium]